MEPGTPPRPREELGKRLRDLRLTAGLTGEELARQLGVNQAKVSRLETGRFRPDVALVDKWLTATNASRSAKKALKELVQAAVTEVAPYRRILRGSVLAAQKARTSLDAQARRIRHFQPSMIPGMFQTAAYARAVLRGVRGDCDGELEEAVAARLERGRRLRQPDACGYEVILTEAALRWQPLGLTPADRAEAWRTILACAEADNVTVRVIPADTPTRQSAQCGYLITDFIDPDDPSIVQVELPAVEMTFAGSDDLAAFETVWQQVADVALGAEESAQFIAGLP